MEDNNEPPLPPAIREVIKRQQYEVHKKYHDDLLSLRNPHGELPDTALRLMSIVENKAPPPPMPKLPLHLFGVLDKYAEGGDHGAGVGSGRVADRLARRRAFLNPRLRKGNFVSEARGLYAVYP
jgi:hypothetical protein